jgi:hypothetical protein
MEKLFSDIVVEFVIIFPTPPISLQSDIWTKSCDQSTVTYVESKFESNPILTLSGEISI